MRDRFGQLPEAMKNLSLVAGIRIKARVLGCRSVQLKKSVFSLEFDENQKIGRQKIEKWVSAVAQ